MLREIERSRMFKCGTGEGCSSVSSLGMDLSNLVTWAHTHGTICNQTPALETAQNIGQCRKDNAVLWMCGVGHAYHWTCGHLHVRSHENEAVERRKRQMPLEVSSQDAASGEKSIKATWSSEKAPRDTSPGVPQQREGSVCLVHSGPARRGNQKRCKSRQSCSAAEQYLSAARGEIKTDLQEVKLEIKDLRTISAEEQCAVDAENQGDGIDQITLPESPPEDIKAQGDLHMRHDQKAAVNNQTATPTSGFTPAESPALTLPYILKSPGSDQKIPESSYLSPGPLSPAEFISETSRTRNSSVSETPKEDFKFIPISDIRAKAQQPGSPASGTFFEFEAIVDIQRQIHLSSPEGSASGAEFGGNAAGKPAEESRLPGSEHAAHPSASLSPESRSSGIRSPESSKKNPLGKKIRNTANIKAFRDWVALHFPSENREICRLPPEDLDRYLASFYSSAKRQNGTDFSASTLYFFQVSIDRYLREHDYEHSVVRGFEFRASQEALRQRHQNLYQKEREREWAILENLTDENVESLGKGGLLSQMSPQGLLHLMFVNIVRGFGRSTHSQSNNLYWGQLVLRKDEAGQEYLEWRNDLSAEEAAGDSAPRLSARPDSPDKCPVQAYKKYAAKRPPDKLHDHDPLYLFPRHMCSMCDQVWFRRKLLTRKKMEKMLKVIIQQAKGPEKKPRK